MIILVVDDDNASRSSLVFFLESCGHQAYSAISAEEGIAFARVLQPHLVILDLDMGGMSGWDFAGFVLAARHRVGLRLVAVSGRERLPDVRRLREVGFDQHLRKPFTFSELQEELHLVGVQPPKAARIKRQA